MVVHDTPSIGSPTLRPIHVRPYNHSALDPTNNLTPSQKGSTNNDTRRRSISYISLLHTASNGDARYTRILLSCIGVLFLILVVPFTNVVAQQAFSGGVSYASSTGPSSGSTGGAIVTDRGLSVNGTSGGGTNDGDGNGGFTPDQPLPPDWDDPMWSSSGAADQPFKVPISRRLGMWSFRCCPNCAAECGGIFVKRICLNRTTEEQINQFHCSRIPAVPVDSYLDWAVHNCSRANCPTWNWDGSYLAPSLGCGISYAFTTATCALNNVTYPEQACWPAPKPQPIAINQTQCGNSVPLLPFQLATNQPGFEPRQFSDLVSLNLTLFLVGGLTKATGTNYDLPADVWRSDDFGTTWINVPVQTKDFTAVHGHSLQSISDSLIVIGGLQHNAPSENVWRSDDFGRNWYICGYLNAGRAQHDSIMFRTGIAIVGGFSQAAVKNDVLWSTDASHFYLQTASAPWDPRTYPSVDVVGDTLVLCGGWLVTGVAARDVWKSWDMVSWTLVTAVTPWTPRVGFVFYSTHRTLVIVGGISETGSIYHQEQWISADVGLTWQLRSALAPIAEGEPQPSPLSKRSWSAYAKMSGDRLFVLGGEYQDALLNDVWLGDRSVKAIEDIDNGDTGKGDETLSGPPSSFVAIVVCLSAAALFFLCVTLVICRHHYSKRTEKRAMLQQTEEQRVAAAAAAQEQGQGRQGEEVELQAVAISPDAVRIIPDPQHRQPHQGEMRRSASGRAVYEPIPVPTPSPDDASVPVAEGVAFIASHEGAVTSSRGSSKIAPPSAAAAGRGHRGSGSSNRSDRSISSTSNSFSRRVGVDSTLLQSSASSVISGSGGSPVAPSVHPLQNVAPPPRSRTPSQGGRGKSSVTSRGKGSVNGTPKSAGRHFPASVSGGGEMSAHESSVSSASAPPVHIHPLLITANGSVSPAGLVTPPPFAVEPSQLAWMQAQISYQASLLAAVVSVQGGNIASGSAHGSFSLPPSAAGVANPAVADQASPAQAEEYFRSVPQLASQQAQLLYVQHAASPIVAAPIVSPEPLETNEGEEEEYQPGQSHSPSPHQQQRQYQEEPSSSAVASVAPSSASQQQDGGSCPSSPDAPTMAGSMRLVADRSSLSVSRHATLPAIQEGEADVDSEGESTEGASASCSSSPPPDQ